MALGRYLQDNFGFTRNELRVLLFLGAATLAGAALRLVLNGNPSPPPRTAPDTATDSIFAARAQTVHASPLSPDPRTPRRRAQPEPPPTGGTIDINSATRADLERLPGIGPVYAGRIIAYRSSSGPFLRVDDLLRVKGIGPKTLERLRPFVRAEPPPRP